MKHLFASALMLGATLMASAQVVSVASIERVNTPLSVDQAVISPDGSMVVASSNDDLSLSKVILADGATTRVAESGTAYGLQFSPDSRQIAYVHESTNAQRLRFKEARQLDLTSGAESLLLPPTRTFNAVAFRGAKAMTFDNNRLASQTAVQITPSKAKAASADQRPVAYIHYGQLMLNRDGRTIALNPEGGEGQSYMWPSVSPDGTKVLYYLATRGTFVCDIDGSNIKRLGVLRAPAWLDDNIIVGMNDIDDGMELLASSIVAVSLDGTQQVITPDNLIALYPTVSADGSKVAFNTAKGELYIININR